MSIPNLRENGNEILISTVLWNPRESDSIPLPRRPDSAFRERRPIEVNAQMNDQSSEYEGIKPKLAQFSSISSTFFSCLRETSVKHSHQSWNTSQVLTIASWVVFTRDDWGPRVWRSFPNLSMSAIRAWSSFTKWPCWKSLKASSTCSPSWPSSLRESLRHSPSSEWEMGIWSITCLSSSERPWGRWVYEVATTSARCQREKKRLLTSNAAKKRSRAPRAAVYYENKLLASSSRTVELRAESLTKGVRSFSATAEVKASPNRRIQGDLVSG